MFLCVLGGIYTVYKVFILLRVPTYRRRSGKRARYEQIFDNYHVRSPIKSEVQRPYVRAAAIAAAVMVVRNIIYYMYTCI